MGTPFFLRVVSRCRSRLHISFTCSLDWRELVCIASSRIRRRRIYLSRYSILVGLFLVTAACASTKPAADPTVAGPKRGPRDFIGAEEIEAAGGGNALDFVRAVRPMWLAKRGPQSFHYEGDVVVYLGTARMGGLQALADMPVSGLRSLRYFDVAAANYKFGPGHPYGAIVVSNTQ